jgi:hypothetical protein
MQRLVTRTATAYQRDFTGLFGYFPFNKARFRILIDDVGMRISKPLQALV